MADTETDYSAAVDTYLAGKNQPALEVPQVKLGVQTGMAVAPNPDLDAELRRAAARTGVPIDSARSDPAYIKKQAQFDNLGLDTLPATNPKTSAYLSNSENAALAHDDIPVLSSIENIWTGAAQGLPRILGGLLRFAGTVADKPADALDSLIPGTIDYTPPSYKTVEGKAVWTEAKFNLRHQTTLERALPMGVGPSFVVPSLEKTDLGYKPGTTWQQVKENPLKNFVPYALETGLVSAPDMAAVMVNAPAYVISATGQFGQNRAENDQRENANLGDLAVAAPAATAVTALDRLGIGEALGLHGAATGVKDVMLKVLKASAVEGGTEAAQQVAQDVAEGAGTKKGLDAGEIADNALAAGAAGAGYGGGIRAVSGAAEVAQANHETRQQKAIDAHVDALGIDTLATASQNSKLRERSPDDFKQFVADVTRDGPMHDVYVNPDMFAQAMDTPEGRAALEAMPEVAKRIPEAAWAGHDLRIPVEDFAAYVAPLAEYNQLADHLKTEPEGLTRAEADEQVKTQADTLKQDFERVAAEKVGDEQFKASADKVTENIRSQLDEAGRHTSDVNAKYADLAGKFFAVQAARTGVSPEEFYAQYPLKVTPGDGSVIGAFDQIPVERAKVLNYETKIPTDPVFTEAVANTKGAELTADGLEINLGRYQKEEQHGDQSVRTGVFYLPEGSPNFKHYRNPGPGVYYGGSDKISGRTLLKTPLFVKGATGGKAPEAAYIALRGKDGFKKLETDISRIMGIKSSLAAREPYLLEEAVSEFLGEHGGNSDDAYHIIQNSKKGNTLRYALQEYAVAHAVREAGHDSVVGYSKGKNGAAISEVFDVRESHYPTPEGDYVLHDKFDVFNQDARGSFNPANLSIALNKNANLSTFLHEMGHFQLEVLANLAARPDAAPEIVDDMNALLKWFGITGNETVEAGTNSGPLEQAVYHGSPYKFDKFSLDHLGKGEGNQAYGWGLYFAGKKEVAEFYRQKLAVERVLVDGQEPASKAQDIAAQYVQIWGPRLNRIEIELKADKTVAAKDRAEVLAQAKDIVDNNRAVSTDKGGQLYEAEIPDETNYLDNEKSWAAQSDAVKTALKNSDIYKQYRDNLSDFSSPMNTRNKEMRGENLYNFLEWKLGSAEAASRKLHEIGILGLKYKGGQIAGATNVGTNYVVFDDKAVKIAQTFYQNGDEGMIGDLPAGRTPLDVWRAMSLDQQRPYHEQFARGFEAYLLEGKAPSAGLRDVFRRFSAWLVSIYRNTQNLRVNLSDEVRQVMDRLVATRDEIAAAEDRNGYGVPFAEKPEGMTDDQWRDYNDLSHDATLTAQEALQARSLRDMQWLEGARSRKIAELQREAKAKRKEVKAEVTAEVNAEPVNQARRYLSHGELDGEVTEDAQKLSIPDLQKMYPLAQPGEAFYELGTGRYGLIAKEGAHPDIVADMFGYDSGDALVRDLIKAEPAKEKIEGLTDQRMLERYGDLIDKQSVERAANEAVHNDARAKFIATGLAALNNSIGDRNVLLAASKAAAKDVIGRTNIRDVRPDVYAAAEARAGRNVLKAMKADDVPLAAEEMRKQLYNSQATRIATQARKDIAKGEQFFKKIITAKDDSISKRRNMDLVNAARAVLEAYGYGAAKNAPGEYMKKLAAYDPVLAADIMPFVEDTIAQAPKSGDVRDITVDQFTAMKDTIAQMWELSARSQQIRIAGQLKAVSDVATETAADLPEGYGPYAAVGATASPTKLEDLKTGILGAVAILRRVEDWSVLKGPAFHRNIFEPMSDASLAFRQSSEKYRGQLLENLKTIKADLTPERIAAPEINYTFGMGNSGGMAELIGALRHTGNESNLYKLLAGRGWAEEGPDGSLDMSRWQAFLDRMHSEGVLQKRHWDYVQSEWNLHEEIKPSVQAAHRAVYGRYFNEVEAAPVDTPFGQYAGGYVPAITDPRIVDERLMREDEAALLGGNAGTFMFPSPGNGFTKARSEGYAKALALDLALAGGQVDAALKFAHLAEPTRDVLRVVKAKELEGKLRSYDPAAATDLLLPWLRRTATQATSTPTSGKGGRMIDGFMSTVRQRAVMSMMFGNLSNTLQNVTGIAPAMIRTGKTNMAEAMFNYARSPKAYAANVAESSPFMADRMTNQMREMATAVREIVQNPNLLEKAQSWSIRHTYFLQHAMQNAVDVVIWTAGYNKAIQEQASNPVSYADMIVRTTQGSSNPVDVSRFESGPAWAKVFTTFSGYFLGQGNLLGTEFAKAKASKSPAAALNVYMLGVAAPALGSALIATALRGGVDDKDGNGIWDELLNMFFGSQFSYLAGGVPVVGPVATAIVNRATGRATDMSISVTPVTSIVEGAIGAPFDVVQLAQGKGSVQKTIRDSASLATVLTGLPITLVAKPVAYTAGVAEGKVQPTGPVDAVRGAVTGSASPASKQ